MPFKTISKRKILLLIGDIFIVIFSINLAFILRLNRFMINHIGIYGSAITTILFLMIYFISFYVFGLYNIRENFRSIRFLSLVLGALVLASLISALTFYVSPFIIGRGIFLISLIITGILVASWRIVFSYFFKLTVKGRNLLLVGKGKAIDVIHSLVKENPEYRVVGGIVDNPAGGEVKGMTVLGGTDSVEKTAEDYKINDIVVVTDPTRSKKLNKALVNCRMKGINVYDMPTFYEYLMQKLPLNYIKEKWFLYSDGFGKLGSRVYKRMKRVLDLIISFLLLVLFLPLGLATALVIKLSSKGPVFYKQERLGKNFERFNLIKFRTMVADAEKGGPRWAQNKDPRVTWLGKILRKSRLDEIPQLINVLKGDMSLIGPRPERECFVKELIKKVPYYSFRLSVEPGLTGWAQVNYRYGSSVEDTLEKLRYDLYYIKNMSLFLDFRILLKTVRVSLFGKGR